LKRPSAQFLGGPFRFQSGLSAMAASSSSLPVRSAVIVAVVLIVVPACNLLVLVPPNVGSHVWRFGAIGVLDNTITLPIVGLAVLNVVLWQTELRRTLRVSSIICFLGAVLVLGLLGLFALDAIQTRRDVLNLVGSGRQPAAAVRVFYVNTAKASAQALVAAAALLLLGGGSWRATGRIRARGRGRRQRSEAQVLVGTAATQRTESGTQPAHEALPSVAADC
jgi:hypothetical protein